MSANQPAETVETIRRVTLEGPLGPVQAVLLGVLLVGLFALVLWCEARWTRKRFLLLFWPLRVTVAAMALWMLLEPTRVNILRRSTPRSIAVVADISGSMGTIDPVEAKDALRWNIAPHADERGNLVREGDCLAVAIARGHARIRSAIRTSDQGGRAEKVQIELEGSQRAVQSAVQHCAAITERLGQASSDLRTQAAQLQRQLQEGLSDGLSPWFERKSLTPLERSASLQSLKSQFESASGRARSLAEALVAYELSRSGASVPDSMQAAKSRWDLVGAVLDGAEAGVLRKASEQVRVRRYAFDSEVSLLPGRNWRDAIAARSRNAASPAAAEAEASTNLSAALEQIGREAGGEMIEAAIVLSDGRHNDVRGRNPREVAAALGTLPVHVVPIGDSRALRDVILHHVNAPQAVAKSDAVVVDAIVSTYECEGEPVRIELLEQDEVIDRRELTPQTSRTDLHVDFSVKDLAFGRHEFVLRVTPLADEASVENNKSSFTVDLIEDQTRLLLADNMPRWEFRYLSNLFRRDERVKCDQLIFNPQPSAVGELTSAELPETLEGWSRYRVIILGDLVPAQFSPESQEALKQHVTQRGGALILIAGPEGMPRAFADQPLSGLLPVEQIDEQVDTRQGYGVVPTAEGRSTAAIRIAGDEAASERTWREAFQLVPIHSLSEYSRAKPTAHTLLSAVPRADPNKRQEPRAFLSWQAIGRGRVIFLSAPETYHLRLRNGDRYHHAFWGQLLRWAVSSDMATGSRTVRISTDKKRYDFSDPVEVTVQTAKLDGTPVPGAKIQAIARQEGQPARTVDLTEDENIPGRYQGRIERLVPGTVEVEAAGKELTELLQQEQFTGAVNAVASIAPALSGELHDTRSDRPLLEQIAEVTGGQSIPPTALGEVIELSSLEPHVSESASREPLWDRWNCLWIICGCLVIEWILRKRFGLA